MISQFALQMTVEEKKSLVAALQSAIAEELASSPGTPTKCPHCPSGDIVRKGRGRKGEQRWLCKGCGSTFSAETRGLLASSKLDAGTWMRFAECMADCLPLRESAERCCVSLPTAWFMRMRACEVMASRLAPFRQASSCQVDGLELEESFAGNHTKGRSFEMPRKRHKSGSDSHRRGISNEKICVMTGINELGDVFAEVCCRGRETWEDVAGSLAGRVGASTAVATDRHRSYPRAIQALGASEHVTVDPKDRSTGNINLVNSMHSRLREFLARFHGVSTRRLSNYLAWFCYREQMRGSDADKRESLFLHASEGVYQSTRRDLFEMPRPFMDFWDGQTPMSTVV